MRAKFVFVSTLLTMNALFIGYAVGFNSRKVKLVDPKLPAYVKPATASGAVKKPPAKPPAPDKKKTAHADNKHAKPLRTGKGAKTTDEATALKPHQPKPTPGNPEK